VLEEEEGVSRRPDGGIQVCLEATDMIPHPKTSDGGSYSHLQDTRIIWNHTCEARRYRIGEVATTLTIAGITPTLTEDSMNLTLFGADAHVFGSLGNWNKGSGSLSLVLQQEMLPCSTYVFKFRILNPTLHGLVHISQLADVLVHDISMQVLVVFILLLFIVPNIFPLLCGRPEWFHMATWDHEDSDQPHPHGNPSDASRQEDMLPETATFDDSLSSTVRKVEEI
jgi:hypothetical protein